MTQGRELITGKGYLRPTMSSAQQKFREPPKVPENVRMGLGNDALPQIRGHTAPNGFGRNVGSKNARSHQCSRANRLPPRNHVAESLNKLKGLNLQDYAFGEMPTTLLKHKNLSGKNLHAGTFDSLRYNVSTAPSWRKSRAQKIDDKVEKLKRCYEKQDADKDGHPLIMSDTERKLKIMQHYFPAQQTSPQ